MSAAKHVTAGLAAEVDAGVAFRVEKKLARLRDPRQGFAETEVESEIRFDPLTGRTARICHITGLLPVAPDYAALAAGTAASCPFCREHIEVATPRFAEATLTGFDATHSRVQDGRIVCGEATLFPNLFPYDDVSTIAVISHDHHLDAADLDAARVADALTLARDFFAHHVAQGLAQDRYGLVTWNYLPASGGSQLHPHWQVALTQHPGNAIVEEGAAEHRWARSRRHTYAEDLIAAERGGARFLHEGPGGFWYTPFAPTGMLGDAACILRGKRCVTDLGDDDIAAFAATAVRMIAAFAKLGMPSFNLSFFPAAFGADAPHVLTARLLPRFYLNPATHVVDASYLQLLLRETFAMRAPEALAEELRALLATPTAEGIS